MKELKKSPKCTEGEHNWERPLELVGGMQQNPGVFREGSEFIFYSACLKCGCGKRESHKRDGWGRELPALVTYSPGRYVDGIKNATR